MFYIVDKTFLINLDVKSTLLWENVFPDIFLALDIWYKVTESWEKQLYVKGYGGYWKLVQGFKNIEK